jgi:hypothetical protein
VRPRQDRPRNTRITRKPGFRVCHGPTRLVLGAAARVIRMPAGLSPISSALVECPRSPKAFGRKIWGRKMPQVHASGIFLPQFFCPPDWSSLHAAAPRSAPPRDPRFKPKTPSPVGPALRAGLFPERFPDLSEAGSAIRPHPINPSPVLPVSSFCRFNFPPFVPLPVPRIVPNDLWTAGADFAYPPPPTFCPLNLVPILLCAVHRCHRPASLHFSL